MGSPRDPAVRRAVARAGLGVIAVTVTLAVLAVPANASAAGIGVIVPNAYGARDWGANGFGQLGDGTNLDRSTSVQAVGLGSGVSQVAAGADHTLAVTSAGVVWAWGRNESGQLGDGTFASHFTPAVVAGLPPIKKVSAGFVFSLALATDGTVWAWGANDRGELGDGTRINRSAPVRIPGLTDVVQIDAGSFFALARRSDGTVVAWGANGGQLGDGTQLDRASPVPVLGLSNVVDISAGSNHSLAARSDGTAWAWGANTFGQLGDGTANHRFVPGQVATSTGMTNVTLVSAGASYSVAVGQGGLVWRWGIPLCLGTACGGLVPPPSAQTLPAVEWIFGVTQISAGANHVVAIRIDGSLWAWGNNLDGQLGNGTTTAETIPTRIYGRDAIRADAGGSHTVAVIAQPVLFPA